MDIFFEIHQDLPREGPGDAASTQKAFAMLTALPQHPYILDVGCGPGMQTLDLIQLTDGKIIAVDKHRPFLERLQQKVQQAGLADRIEVRPGDMCALDFAEHTFDVIWSEGAIYIVGFAKGLQSWKPLLKTGGYVAVTELSWLKSHPPQEAQRYWELNYPAMQDITSNLNIINAAGYQVIGHFSLPESAWWEHYYDPLAKRLPGLQEKYRTDPEALAQIEMEYTEMDIYRKYAACYGYVFYVMHQPD